MQNLQQQFPLKQQPTTTPNPTCPVPVDDIIPETNTLDDVFISEVAAHITEVPLIPEPIDVSHMLKENQAYIKKHLQPNTTSEAPPKRSTRSSGQIK